MEQRGFKKGDNVRLVSNGPIMKIVDEESFDKAICQWTMNGALHEGTFHIHELVHAVKIVREWKVG